MKREIPPSQQLSMFAIPATEGEIFAGTALEHTLSLFQTHLYRDGKTQHTIYAFTADLHLLLEFAGGSVPISAISTDMLNRYLHWMEHERGIPCSRKTYARRVTTLKVFFRWLHGLGAIPADPAVAVLQRSGQAPLTNVLEAPMIDAALKASREFRTVSQEPDTRPAFLFRLLLETGIKKGEAMRLTRADFEGPESSAPMLLVRQPSTTHQYKERRIPVSRELATLMQEYAAQYHPPKTLFTCTARNLEYILAAIGEAADIPFKVSFEMMRWTSALRDYLNGAAPEAIREKLGLSPISWVETFSKIRRLAGEAPSDS